MSCLFFNVWLQKGVKAEEGLSHHLKAGFELSVEKQMFLFGRLFWIEILLAPMRTSWQYMPFSIGVHSEAKNRSYSEGYKQIFIIVVPIDSSEAHFSRFEHCTEDSKKNNDKY